MSKLNIDQQTIKELFTNKRADFLIPDYQRPYALSLIHISIKAVSEETIQRTLQWCNNLPRKLLNYRTPLEVFLEEVNKIVDLDTVQFHIAI